VRRLVIVRRIAGHIAATVVVREVILPVVVHRNAGVIVAMAVVIFRKPIVQGAVLGTAINFVAMAVVLVQKMIVAVIKTVLLCVMMVVVIVLKRAAILPIVATETAGHASAISRDTM